MTKLVGLRGILFLCLCLGLAGTAQASAILGDYGSTQPKNLVPGSGLQGIVNAAVFSLTGSASDPYGSGVSTATLVAAGFSGAGVDSFLYLYQTDNTGSLEITQNTVAWTPALVGGGGTSFGQLIRTTFSPNPLSPLSIPTNTSPFSPGIAGATVIADATSVTVSTLNPGPSSLQADYLGAGLTVGSHSDLWGYTSNFAPQLTDTGIEDHGTNAQGLVPTAAVAVPTPAAIWGGLGLLGALFTAKVTRRK